MVEIFVFDVSPKE